MVTEYPLDWSNLARDEAKTPLPREDVTPPVTNMYLVADKILEFKCF